MKELRNRVPTSIGPTDILTFYFIAYLFQTKGRELGFRGFDQFTRELESIKRKYLDTFTDVIENQLVKYIQRGRHDKNQEGNPIFDLDLIARRPMSDRIAGLVDAMNTTYRSDMRRRNEVWIALAGHLENLAKTKKPESLIYYIDRINNQVHNVPETVLYKLENGQELSSIFDRAHQAKDPRDYINEVKPSIVNAAKALNQGESPLDVSRRRIFGPTRGAYRNPQYELEIT
jgi:hypothetical protein